MCLLTIQTIPPLNYSFFYRSVLVIKPKNFFFFYIECVTHNGYHQILDRKYCSLLLIVLARNQKNIEPPPISIIHDIYYIAFDIIIIYKISIYIANYSIIRHQLTTNK